jgi:hypothetical protein
MRWAAIFPSCARHCNAAARHGIRPRIYADDGHAGDSSVFLIRVGQSRPLDEGEAGVWISMPLGCAAATGSWQHGWANQSPHLVELALSPLS